MGDGVASPLIEIPLNLFWRQCAAYLAMQP